MKQRILSLLCALSICFALVPGAAALEGEAQRAADTLVTLGLLGSGDLAYDMSQPAIRFNAATMLANLFDVAEPGSNFPDATASLTANDWFSMLLQALGYQDGVDFTSADAAVFARRIGLASRAYTGMMNVGDLFESALDALRFPYWNGGGTVVGRLVERGICAPSAVNALGLNQGELTARQISDRFMSAVFSMTLYNTSEPIDEHEPDADASGFFISPDGLAVTNYHSIDGAAQAVATLVTGESCMVERVIWYDVEMDLAVIRVSRTTVNNQNISMFACLDLVGTTDLRPGDLAYTLSNPLGLGLAVSSGVISATARTVERYELPCVMNTADISQGSSGGALLNAFGRVVAVTSGAYRVGNSMYLAVPVDILMTLDLSGAGETLQEVSDKETAKLLEAAQEEAAQEEAVEEPEEPEAA